jgi:hypothetical protein
MLFKLEWKVWRIESGLKALLKDAGIKPLVWSFGAYYIDPKHLVFVVGVPTDQDKSKLKSDPNFDSAMRFLLTKYNWPLMAREYVAFDIESQQTVDRETNGNWWYHYK